MANESRDMAFVTLPVLQQCPCNGVLGHPVQDKDILKISGGIQSEIRMRGLSRYLTRAPSVPMFSIVVAAKVSFLASGRKSSLRG